ncbi:hypothetical protein SAMN05660662_3885 [Blastococcus aurantiacus]|uniref:Uncharacterized protein n=3 Tax=Blastococcus aurantiacus TaxID=1550231 RepID=A0A1G7Q2X3_9ACTN|nr:hypothetical protein SAMN05660662_3885 [Blastococcus aurantiacus]
MNTDELREALRRDAELAGRPPTDLVPRVAGLRRRSTRRRAGVVSCVLAIAVAVGGLTILDGAREQDRGAAGQDGSSAAAAGVDTEAAAAAYRTSIAGTNAAASSSISPASLAEYLPNRRYRVINGDVATLTDAVVVGHVTSVSPGRAFYAPEEDETSTIEVPFDDPRAMWRTAHARLTVTEVLGGQVTDGTIRVGFVVGTSATSYDVLAAGLPALGDLVLFLESSSPVHDYEPDLWSVASNGAMLAEIESDGRLTLPALEPYQVEPFLAVNPTLDSLRAAAQEPPREVPFETLQD